MEFTKEDLLKAAIRGIEFQDGREDTSKYDCIEDLIEEEFIKPRTLIINDTK